MPGTDFNQNNIVNKKLSNESKMDDTSSIPFFLKKIQNML